MKGDDGRRKSVPTMPVGRGDDYLSTIRLTQNWLSKPRTHDEFGAWFATLGWTSPTGTDPARRFLVRVGLIDEDPEGLLRRPQDSFDTDESIIRALHKHCRFIGELLEEIATTSKSTVQLMQAAKNYGVNDQPFEIERRGLWLRSAGMLLVREGKYQITDKGREFLGHNEWRYALNTILYGPPGTGKTYATFRRCVDICEGKDATRTEAEVRSCYEALVDEGRVEFVTFHQSYGYEEFVEGLRPKRRSQHLNLVPEDGVLKRIAEDARKDTDQPYVLVIDQINRANISKVLGELITLLEVDKREGAINEVSVTLPYSGTPFRLPSNLYVLGTMNTADRSIALIDTALRRRFRFKELAPDARLLQTVDDVDLPAVLTAINERLEYLIDRDHLIGHAWLMGIKSKADLDDVMRHKIIPLIAEYFYDDWQKVQAVLGGTDHFVIGRDLERPPGLGDEEAHETRRSWEIQKEFAEGAYDSLVSGND